MSLQLRNCRICGLNFSNENILTHELNCLQASQEQVDIDSFNDNDNEHVGQADEIESYANCSEEYQTKNDDSTDLDEESEALPKNMSDSSFGSDSFPSHAPRTSESDSNPGMRSNPLRTHSCNSRSPKRKNLHPRYTKFVTKSYDRTKKENLFPPTKKYRYYPVTCEYCRKRFQPNELKAHQRKHHFAESGYAQRVQSEAIRKGYAERNDASRSKSVGGIPRQFKICYICGRMYGSKSIKIHEPKCLDKWRTQNEHLPPNRRAPEPVKPEELMPVSSDKGYSIPDHDRATEAAFLSHLRSLIPCGHCSRTFSPDRILKHESCCIERPRTRECVTPVGGEIGR